MPREYRHIEQYEKEILELKTLVFQCEVNFRNTSIYHNVTAFISYP